MGVEREHEMFNTGRLQIAIRCHDDGSTMAALDVRGKQTGQSPVGDHWPPSLYPHSHWVRASWGFPKPNSRIKNKIQFLFQTRLGRPLARKLRWGSHVIIQFRLIHSRFVPYFRFSSSLRRLSRKNAPFLLAIAKIGGTPMPKLILTLFLELKKCSNWLGGPKLIVKRFQKWKVAQNRLRGGGDNMGNTKGTTDPRVEFSFTKETDLVQTKFMIKFHVQNHDQSSTSKSQPNISISTKLQL